MATASCDGGKQSFRMQAVAREGIVAIIVGTEDVEYHVHKSVLMEHSEYFKKALQGPWKEAEGVVRLHDVEPAVFDIFVDWIYSQKVPSLGKETLCSTVLERADGQVMRLKATILGNRLFAPAFVEACRRNLIECIMEWRGCYYATIIYAFANLATDDLLLKMMVDVDVKNEAGNESQQKRRSCGRIYLLTFCSQSEINSQRWLARADSPVRILCLTHPITTGTPQKSHKRSAKRRMKSNSAKLQKVQGMSGLLQVRHTDTPCYQGPRVEKRSSTDTSLGVIGGSTKLMTYRSTH